MVGPCNWIGHQAPSLTFQWTHKPIYSHFLQHDTCIYMHILVHYMYVTVYIYMCTYSYIHIQSIHKYIQIYMIYMYMKPWTMTNRRPPTLNTNAPTQPDNLAPPHHWSNCSPCNWPSLFYLSMDSWPNQHTAYVDHRDRCPHPYRPSGSSPTAAPAEGPEAVSDSEQREPQQLGDGGCVARLDRSAAAGACTAGAGAWWSLSPPSRSQRSAHSPPSSARLLDAPLLMRWCSNLGSPKKDLDDFTNFLFCTPEFATPKKNTLMSRPGRSLFEGIPVLSRQLQFRLQARVGNGPGQFLGCEVISRVLTTRKGLRTLRSSVVEVGSDHDWSR